MAIINKEMGETEKEMSSVYEIVTESFECCEIC